MGFLDDVASSWAREDEDAYTDEAHRDFRQAKKAAQVADAVADSSNERMTDEEAVQFATMVVTWSDVGAKRFAGPQYAQSPEETAKLIEVSAPVLQKHVPKSWMVGASIPIELVLLATVAMIYWPKYAGSKARAAAEKRGETPPPEEKEVGGVALRKGMHAVS